MDTLTTNTEHQLVHVISSIKKNPQSWAGWHILRLSLTELDENSHQDCIIWAKSILESYLKTIEGRVYYTQQNGIHVLCRNAPDIVLNQAAQQITELVYSENKAHISYDIFDLTYHGLKYAREMLEEMGDHLTHQDIPSDQTNKVKITPLDLSNDTIKVLLVEDDPVARWMVRHVLKDTCDFAVAPTGTKAFSLYETYQPDVVFLDIDLPDHNGHEVLDWMMEKDHKACVVMLSGNNSLDNITGMIERGARGFIAKPFLKEQLLEYVYTQPV